jgi:hypothetical protein
MKDDTPAVKMGAIGGGTVGSSTTSPNGGKQSGVSSFPSTNPQMNVNAYANLDKQVNCRVESERGGPFAKTMVKFCQ